MATELPGLLRLPGELRNQIYDYILTPPTRFCIHDMLHECYISSQVLLPPLLQVNKQIRRETASIFFAETLFQYHTLPQLERWLKALCLEHRCLIRVMRKWTPLFTEERVERDMREARGMLRRLGMWEGSAVVVIGCMNDEEGNVRPHEVGRWFAGPGEVGSEGSVTCVVSKGP